VISLMKDADLTFNEDNVEIREANKMVRYFYCDPSHIVTPTTASVAFPDSADMRFSVDSESLVTLLKAADTLQLPTICIRGINGTLSLDVVNPEGSTKDSFSMAVRTIDEDRDFAFYIDTKRLVMPLSADYDIAVSQQGFVKFETSGLDYYVTVEGNSYFQ
jgi:hypothetical protein